MVSFCTGGIRCEKAALWLRADGMGNVLQLDGGILGYFEQVGGQGYDGRCFVFDDRIALDPALAPLVDGMDRAACAGPRRCWCRWRCTRQMGRASCWGRGGQSG